MFFIIRNENRKKLDPGVPGRGGWLGRWMVGVRGDLIYASRLEYLTMMVKLAANAKNCKCGGGGGVPVCQNILFRYWETGSAEF